MQIELPVFTFLVLNYSPMGFVFLALSMVGSIFMTWRHGSRRFTLWANIGCLLATGAWLALVNFSLVAPLYSIQEALRERSR
jgi:hypothetical protein